MRGLVVFGVFFTIFLMSSLAIPSPLFPGTTICFLFEISESGHVSLVSAFVNGVFYGLIVWIVFSISFRWVERTSSKNKLVKKKERLVIKN